MLFRSVQLPELADLAWPVTRLGEAMEAIARQADLQPRPSHAPPSFQSLDTADDARIEQWVQLTAAHLGIEAEPVQAGFAQVDELVRGIAPAVVELDLTPGPAPSDDASPAFAPPSARSYLALLRGGREIVLIAPDLSRHTVPPQVLRDAICRPLQAPYVEPVDRILARARVAPERRPRVRNLILSEQLAGTPAARGWLLRESPAASYVRQARAARLLPLGAIVLVTIVIQQVLVILTWGIIGGGALQGHFDWVWLWAWALLLLSAIPLRMLTSGAAARLGTHIGGIFRGTLLYGSLKLEPEEIRHEGIGHFLDRIMDADVVQYNGVNSALTVLLAGSQIITALVVLWLGAGGYITAGLLALTTAVMVGLGWEYWRRSQWAAQGYREMTNNLVERLIGHRTRLAQQEPASWHTQEDRELSGYLETSTNEARLGNWLGSLPQAWMILGLATSIGIYVTQQLSPTDLAISLGGVLLAQQALSAIALQIATFIPLTLAWKQVRPLFQAARRGEAPPVPAFLADDAGARAANGGAAHNNSTAVVTGQAPAAPPLMTLRNIAYRYRNNARLALDDVNLQINPGDRMLVEGPSGGGKSTLAALLAGLRLPETGLLLLRGYDRVSVGSEAWRQKVVVAPQFHENHVFAETFGFNLLMGRHWPAGPEDEQEAITICGELGLDTLLAHMPSGLQQIVGESGWQLSHGERSRLYIARALLQRAELIILDESFAALDPENLARALSCVLRRAPTLMVVAHP